eukprot:c7160_g1_i1.p1 GENE.c7160_g1_i1~~c7160_g1_i1.p1  ORF type:complete len:120 (-),score=43.02 c7160_g1_i1:42-377(-)
MSCDRHVFVAELHEGKYEEYRKHHDNIWPEVSSGLKKAGINHLSIYLVPQTNKMVMTIETTPGLDLAAATGPGSNYRLNEKCKEWEEMMATQFHGGWTKCTEIHSSEKNWK